MQVNKVIKRILREVFGVTVNVGSKSSLEKFRNSITQQDADQFFEDTKILDESQW